MFVYRYQTALLYHWPANLVSHIASRLYGLSLIILSTNICVVCVGQWIYWKNTKKLVHNWNKTSQARDWFSHRWSCSVQWLCDIQTDKWQPPVGAPLSLNIYKKKRQQTQLCRKTKEQYYPSETTSVILEALVGHRAVNLHSFRENVLSALFTTGMLNGGCGRRSPNSCETERALGFSPLHWWFPPSQVALGGGCFCRALARCRLLPGVVQASGPWGERGRKRVSLIVCEPKGRSLPSGITSWAEYQTDSVAGKMTRTQCKTVN